MIFYHIVCIFQIYHLHYADDPRTQTEKKYINILLSRMKTDIKLNINMSHIYHTRQVTNNMTLMAFHIL